MSIRRILGDISCQYAETFQLEWKIEDVFSLSKEPGDFYISPGFIFCGHIWSLLFYPNGGKDKDDLEGTIRIDLLTAEPCVSVNVMYSVAIKTANGDKAYCRNATVKFINDNKVVRGFLLKKSQLLGRRRELAPLDVLIITVTLETKIPQVSDICWRRSKDKLCQNMENLLSRGEHSDVILKLPDREFPAHQLILKMRSPVFADILKNKVTKEKECVVEISDIETDVFGLVLSYLYSAEVRNINWDNIFKVYEASYKYDLVDLKSWCYSYILENVSVDTIYDVLSFADKYEELGAKKCAEQYFVKHSRQIIGSDKWVEFCTQNDSLTKELMNLVRKDYWF